MRKRRTEVNSRAIITYLLRMRMITIRTNPPPIFLSFLERYQQTANKLHQISVSEEWGDAHESRTVRTFGSLQLSTKSSSLTIFSHFDRRRRTSTSSLETFGAGIVFGGRCRLSYSTDLRFEFYKSSVHEETEGPTTRIEPVNRIMTELLKEI